MWAATDERVRQGHQIPHDLYLRLWDRAVLRSKMHSCTSSTQSGIIEIREYTAKPECFADFIKISSEYAPVRKELLPFLGMFTCDLGGVLHKVTHIYHYKDLEERERVRAAAGQDERWRKSVTESRKFVAHQTNKVLAEAGPVYEALGVGGAATFRPAPPLAAGGNPVYELRTYTLQPGSDSGARVIEAFRQGVPDKAAADPEGGQLVLMGCTEVGMTDTVVELWRYSSAQACMRARQAARSAPAWVDAMASVAPLVQSITSELLYPTAFSPWQ